MTRLKLFYVDHAALTHRDPPVSASWLLAYFLKLSTVVNNTTFNFRLLGLSVSSPSGVEGDMEGSDLSFWQVGDRKS